MCVYISEIKTVTWCLFLASQVFMNTALFVVVVVVAVRPIHFPS